MTERFKLSLSGMWLLASLVSIILPIFLPSYDSPNLAANTIGAATATMFILSFPGSLFGIPLLYMVNYVLGTDMNSIGGMYVNLLLLFVLGLVQWFWIVPRLVRREPALQSLQLPEQAASPRLTEFRDDTARSFFDEKSQTPLERVLRGDDE